MDRFTFSSLQDYLKYEFIGEPLCFLLEGFPTKEQLINLAKEIPFQFAIYLTTDGKTFFLTEGSKVQTPTTADFEEMAEQEMEVNIRIYNLLPNLRGQYEGVPQSSHMSSPESNVALMITPQNVIEFKLLPEGINFLIAIRDWILEDADENNPLWLRYNAVSELSDELKEEWLGTPETNPHFGDAEEEARVLSYLNYSNFKRWWEKLGESTKDRFWKEWLESLSSEKKLHQPYDWSDPAVDVLLSGKSLFEA